MSYGTAAGVAARVPGLTLDDTSTPDGLAITEWLDQGAAIINRTLSGAGYSVPVASDADVYDELTALNEQYAAALALRARGIDQVSGSEITRDVRMMEEFRAQLRELAGSDLTALGVTLARTTGQRRRRVGTVQMRRIDGFSATYEGATSPYDYPSE